jgi:hypothetical protein
MIDWKQVRAALAWNRRMAQISRAAGREERAREYDEMAQELQSALDYRGEALYETRQGR